MADTPLNSILRDFKTQDLLHCLQNGEKRLNSTTLNSETSSASQEVNSTQSARSPGNKSGSASSDEEDEDICAADRDDTTGEEMRSSKRKKRSSTSSVNEESQKKRQEHNDTERKRRLKMNDLFENLRHLIPDCQKGLHKAELLRQTVEHVTKMHLLVSTLNEELHAANRRCRQLEDLLVEMKEFVQYHRSINFPSDGLPSSSPFRSASHHHNQNSHHTSQSSTVASSNPSIDEVRQRLLADMESSYQQNYKGFSGRANETERNLEQQESFSGKKSDQSAIGALSLLSNMKRSGVLEHFQRDRTQHAHHLSNLSSLIGQQQQSRPPPQQPQQPQQQHQGQGQGQGKAAGGAMRRRRLQHAHTHTHTRTHARTRHVVQVYVTHCCNHGWISQTSLLPLSLSASGRLI
mmetsp:Transcript_12915/g.32952  ORF Transcript_12915/g.32952 Transcript_12915/m.32952 type:complete len:406 (-) Transcript_12915:155-1372(-)